MTMTAKYSGTCTACGQRFVAGAAIEWAKGAGARHATPDDCQAATRAAAQAPAAAPTLDMRKVVAFLTAAQARGLKAPKARFLAPDGRSELRVAMAGRASKYPGSVQVYLADEWIGRVMPDGAVAGRLAQAPDVLALLDTIAGNPAEAARAFGAVMGRCSFCALPLTDEGSTEVGYGPICAQKFGLPHRPKGTRAVREVVA
jgi:Family of unknown function (DUF6011)